MKYIKFCAPTAALSCFLFFPAVGQAASWTEGEGAGGDYEISDTTNGTTPLIIKAATPSNTLFLDNTGNLGLGNFPRRDPILDFSPRFYIYDQTPDIELEDWDDDQIWQIFADGGDVSDGGTDDLGGIGFFDQTAGRVPFFIESEAPNASLYITTNGLTGVGTFDPEEQLHVVSDVFDYVRPLLVENTSGRGFSGFRLKIASDSWIDFNNSGGKFRVNADQSPGSEFEVQANGNSKVRGTMTAISFIQSSDRNAKQDIVDVNRQAVLDKVVALPITEWSYKADPTSRHIGPMAQDFFAAFQLGNTDKGLSTVDAGGVALAAIQGLKQEKDAQLAERDVQIAHLQTQLHQLKTEQEDRLMQLELALTEVLRNQSSEAQVGSVN